MEIIISVLILSYAVTTLLGEISQAVRMTAKAKVLVTAAQLGRNLLHEIQLEGKFSTDKKQGQFEDFADFAYEYEIEKVNLEEIMPLTDEQTFVDIKFERLHKIKLVVSWHQAGRQESYEIFSYLFSEKT